MTGMKQAWKHAEEPATWFYRLLLVGLLSWAGLTLNSVDKAVHLNNFRLQQLERHHTGEISYVEQNFERS